MFGDLQNLHGLSVVKTG
jgi:outer membrane immunogenic protein